MKPLSVLLLFIVAALHSFANDSTFIIINKASFSANDTIQFKCTIPNYAQQGLAVATLNVWIEALDKSQIWKYRYPLIEGEVQADLTISNEIKPGKYAINFIIQRGMLTINGNLKNNYTHDSLNFLMLVKEKDTYISNVKLNANGDFVIPNILFEEQAFFLFTPSKKVRRNDLFITVNSPVDSIFSPVATVTYIVDVKPELVTSNIQQEYVFNFHHAFGNTTLPDVKVTAKGKSRVQRFDEENSTGLFKNATRIFDGLDEYSISSSGSIADFLRWKLPRFKVENGRMYWRDELVTLYIDEFRLESWESWSVNPRDVAMIKVYDPPAGALSNGSSGGVIAVYTRRGNFENENNKTRRYKFLFKGYTALESVWK